MFDLDVKTTGAKIFHKEYNSLVRVEEFSPIVKNFSPAHYAKRHYFVGADGSGKSYNIARHLLRPCLDQTTSQLPRISWIHSGSGENLLLKTLSKTLSAHKKVVIQDKMLTNTASCAINPFDTLMGVSQPIPHSAYATKCFLKTLFSIDGKAAVTPQLDNFVSHLLHSVFDFTHGSKGDGRKMYRLAQNFELDRVVFSYRILDFTVSMNSDADNKLAIDCSLPVANQISYIDLTRYLHIAGLNRKTGSFDQKLLFRARDIAWQLSIPTMTDLLTILTDKPAPIYDHIVEETNETLGDFAYRIVLDTIEHYPCFSGPTTINTAHVRVLSLNLSEVTKDADHRRKSLFLQAARMVGMTGMNYRLDDLMAGHMEEAYVEYYKKILESTALNFIEEPYKALAIEDVGLIKEDDNLRLLFEHDIRESKSLGINLVYAASSLSDFDCAADGEQSYFLKSIQTVCFLSKPLEDDIALFKTYFTDNDEVLSDLISIDSEQFFVYKEPQVERAFASSHLVLTKVLKRLKKPNHTKQDQKDIFLC